MIKDGGVIYLDDEPETKEEGTVSADSTMVSEWVAIKHFSPMKRKLLMAVAAGANYREACRLAKCNDTTIFNYQRVDPDFKKMLEEAKERSVILFEDVLDNCARKAEHDSKYQTSLIFLLKSRKREVYGDYQTIKKTNQEPISVILEDEKPHVEEKAELSRVA